MLAIPVVFLALSSGSPHLSTSPPSRITWRQFAGLGLTTFILLGVLVHSTMQSWQQHEHQYFERANGFARTVASHLGLVLRGIEGDLRALRLSLGQDPGDPRHANAVLAAYAARHVNTRTLLMFDASGALTASSTPDMPLGAITVDVDSLNKHREDRGATLRISAPFDWPGSDERMVVATIGIRNPSGHFLGVVGALLSASQFLDGLISLKPSHLTRLTVLRSDGQYVMRIPAFQPGMRLAASRSSSLWSSIEDGRVVTRTVPSPEDGNPVYAVFRRIDGLPLFVAVTIKKSTIQAEWWQANADKLVAYALLTLTALAANAIVFRRLRRSTSVALRQSQASLDQTEARFRDAIESLQDGFSLWNAQGNLVLWNRRYAELYPTIREHLRVGVSFAELTQIYVNRISATDSPIAQQRRLAEYTARFHNAVGDASYGAPDDKIVDVSRSRTAEGGIVSLHRDVTLQRRTTAALSASDALFRDAMESLGEGLTIWDSEDRLVLWNRRYLELTPQMEPHLRAGATFSDLYATLIDIQAPELSQEARAQRIAKRLAARGNSTAPYSLVGPNGTTLEVTERRTSSGGIVSVYRDVTQAREFERAIIESEARFRDGIDSMGEGFVLWDAQDRLVAWNKHSEILLPLQSRMYRPGISFSSVVDLLESLTPDKNDPAAWAAHIAQRRGRRECLGQTISFTAGSGRLIELVDRATSDGGIVSIYRDVTDAHRLLERLQASESELQRALVAEREMNAQQRRFISIASHEFRTPLAIIDSTAQRIQARMAEADEQNADMLKRMDRIRGSVSRMTDIIDRTLTTARLDEGRFEFEPASLDLGKLLQDVVARQRSIVPSFAIEIALPATETIVTADAKLLELVFTNIVSNAVKYSGKSRRIEVMMSSGDDTVTIDVRDHGIGVPPDELEKLFTRFYRASTAQGIPGTGIGLHLANELVQMHGGRIEVFSELGRGSRFVVRLPREAARRDAAA